MNVGVCTGEIVAATKIDETVVESARDTESINTMNGTELEQVLDISLGAILAHVGCFLIAMMCFAVFRNISRSLRPRQGGSAKIQTPIASDGAVTYRIPPKTDIDLLRAEIATLQACQTHNSREIKIIGVALILYGLGWFVDKCI